MTYPGSQYKDAILGVPEALALWRLGESAADPFDQLLITNLIAAPSFEAGVAEWTGLNATLAASSTAFHRGTQSARVTVTSTGTAIIHNQSNRSVATQGVSQTLSAFIQASAAGRTASLQITYYDAAGSVLADTGGSNIPLANGSMTQLTYTPTAPPAGTVSVRSLVNLVGGSAGEFFYVDSFTLVNSLSAYDFDGSSPNAQWTGAPNASTSVLFAIKAAEETGTFDGMYTGGYTLGRPGALVGDDDTAVTFNGLNSQVIAPLVPNFHGASCLVNLTGSNSHGSWIKVGDGTTGLGFGIGSVTMENNGLNMIVLFEGVTWVIGPSLAGLTGYHLLAFSVDPTGTFVRFYIDGVYVKTVVVTTPAVIATSGSTYLGGYVTTAGGLRWSSATIDEIAAFSGDPSAQVFAQHYRVSQGQEFRPKELDERRYTPKTNLVTSTNFVANPRAALNVTDGGWTIATGTVARDSTHGPYPNGESAFLLTAAGVSTPDMRMTALVVPASPGQVWASSAQFRNLTAPRGCRTYLDFYDSSGVRIQVQAGVDVTPSGAAWGLAVRPGMVAPAGTASVRHIAQFTATTAGDQVLINSCWLGQVPHLNDDPPPYFDGDSSYAAWQGTPHNSSSDMINYNMFTGDLDNRLPSGILCAGPEGRSLDMGEAAINGGVVTADPYVQGSLRGTGLFVEGAV